MRRVAVGYVPFWSRDMCSAQHEGNKRLPVFAVPQVHLNLNPIITGQGGNFWEDSSEFNEHLLGRSTRQGEYCRKGVIIIGRGLELRTCCRPRQRPIPAWFFGEPEPKILDDNWLCPR